jgi:hypothetical protein
LKDHPLVFKLKLLRRSPRKGASFKVNRSHPASEQNRSSDADGDNG